MADQAHYVAEGVRAELQGTDALDLPAVQRREVLDLLSAMEGAASSACAALNALGQEDDLSTVACEADVLVAGAAEGGAL